MAKTKLVALYAYLDMLEKQTDGPQVGTNWGTGHPNEDDGANQAASGVKRWGM